jgi:predicted membrane metal-binding protein
MSQKSKDSGQMQSILDRLQQHLVSWQSLCKVKPWHPSQKQQLIFLCFSVPILVFIFYIGGIVGLLLALLVFFSVDMLLISDESRLMGLIFRKQKNKYESDEKSALETRTKSWQIRLILLLAEFYAITEYSHYEKRLFYMLNCHGLIPLPQWLASQRGLGQLMDTAKEYPRILEEAELARMNSVRVAQAKADYEYRFATGMLE